MSLARLKISLAQSNPTVGGIELNAEYVLVKAYEAEKNRSDLIIFPEMFLSGYQPLDLVNKRSFLENISLQIQNIARKTINLKVRILVGAPWVLDGEIYNAFISIYKGTINILSKKSHSPNYDVFDEKRFFVSGHELELLDLGALKIGFPIC